GGAIAVYAPAGLSDNAAAAALNAALAAELGRGHATLGDAIRAALAAWTPADPTAAYHRDLYILLGDPALLIKR
ncbi:MAG TPA: C25 family cysteine peptidase, partial [Acidobacteriota bacterium]|nr:C25 family cysteine peptidase [Acidobacteriota bacterium]